MDVRYVKWLTSKIHLHFLFSSYSSSLSCWMLCSLGISYHMESILREIHVTWFMCLVWLGQQESSLLSQPIGAHNSCRAGKGLWQFDIMFNQVEMIVFTYGMVGQVIHAFELPGSAICDAQQFKISFWAMLVVIFLYDYYCLFCRYWDWNFHIMTINYKRPYQLRILHCQ